MSERALLRELFDAAIAAVHGERAVRCALRAHAEWFDAGAERPREWAVLAMGKAAVEMARGARGELGGRVRAGLAVTTRESAMASTGGLDGFEIVGAGHPVPDRASVAAGRRVLEFAERVPADRGCLVLVSGGSSALCALPAAGVTLADVSALTTALLRAGLDIAAMNAVRKHVSAIKGGRLLAASGASHVVTLAISDVAGSAPETIGSGPTVPDPTTYADALAICTRVPGVPDAVLAHLEAGARGAHPETPKRGDPCFARSRFTVVASLEDALAAAARGAAERGIAHVVLGPTLYGEARSLALPLVEDCIRARAGGARMVIGGGEPVVTLRGDGRGGRAQELALAFALEAHRMGLDRYTALFAGTDGRDGPTDAAGAYVSPDLISAGSREAAEARLACNDSHTFFAAADALLVTGPTGTNVNDIALISLDA